MKEEAGALVTRYACLLPRRFFPPGLFDGAPGQEAGVASNHSACFLLHTGPLLPDGERGKLELRMSEPRVLLINPRTCFQAQYAPAAGLPSLGAVLSNIA